MYLCTYVKCRLMAFTTRFTRFTLIWAHRIGSFLREFPISSWCFHTSNCKYFLHRNQRVSAVLGCSSAAGGRGWKYSRSWSLSQTVLGRIIIGDRSSCLGLGQCLGFGQCLRLGDNRSLFLKSDFV